MTETHVDPTAMTGLELLRWMAAHPEPQGIGALIGMQVEEVQDGTVSFSTLTRAEFANPLGSVHGGICATMLDSVMGCAVHSTLPAGVGYSTLELSVNYIRTVPTDGRKLIATGTTVHVGRTTATAEGKVHDEEGRLVAHGSTTCLIHRPLG